MKEMKMAYVLSNVDVSQRKGLQNTPLKGKRNYFLYHFDSIFLIPVTVFPTRFPHRNSEKRHYETNIIPCLATFENSWEKLIIRANFWVVTQKFELKMSVLLTHFPEVT